MVISPLTRESKGIASLLYLALSSYMWNCMFYHFAWTLCFNVEWITSWEFYRPWLMLLLKLVKSRSCADVYFFSICGSLCVEVGRAGWIEENNKGGGVQRRGDCWDTVRGLEVACNYSTTTPPTRAMAYTSTSRLSEVRGFVIYICVRGSVFNKQEDNTKWTAYRQRCGRDHCDRFQSGIPYSTNEMRQWGIGGKEIKEMEEDGC